MEIFGKYFKNFEEFFDKVYLKPKLWNKSG